MSLKREHQQIVYDRSHSLLQRLLLLIPSAVDLIGRVLGDAFPHKRIIEPQTHIDYVRNCLQVLDYLPSLQSKIFDSIVEKTLVVDVSV
jgi:hypothetical protein